MCLWSKAHISNDRGFRAHNKSIKRFNVRPVSTISSTRRRSFPSSSVSGSYTKRTLPLDTVESP